MDMPVRNEKDARITTLVRASAAQMASSPSWAMHAPITKALSQSSGGSQRAA